MTDSAELQYYKCRVRELEWFLKDFVESADDVFTEHQNYKTRAEELLQRPYQKHQNKQHRA